MQTSLHKRGTSWAGRSATASINQPCCLQHPRRRHLARAEPSDGPQEPNKFVHPEMDGEQPSTSSSIPDSLPMMQADGDWRAFRARLVASSKGLSNSDEWAHSIPKPEKGSVLISHPLMFSASQTYFNQAVIFIIDHSEDGSYGIILNKPSTYKLKNLDTNRADVLDPFADSPLYLGGDVGNGDMIMLHTVDGLEGSLQVVNGVHIGGVNAASAAIQNGKCTADQFRWYTNYAGWGRGQLEGECKRGVWFTAAVSPSLLLKDLQNPGAGVELWHTVLDQMGGDFAALSRTVKDKERSKEGKNDGKAIDD